MAAAHAALVTGVERMRLGCTQQDLAAASAAAVPPLGQQRASDSPSLPPPQGAVAGQPRHLTQRTSLTCEGTAISLHPTE